MSRILVRSIFLLVIKNLIFPLTSGCGQTSISLKTSDFSVTHGFYYSQVQLNISSKNQEYKIYYTTDCSQPSAKNGKLFSGPIVISSNTVIRAVLVRDGISTGNTVTQTYLFPEDIIRQSNNPPGYPSTWGPYTGISGTSIADYEMDPEMTKDPVFAEDLKRSLIDLPTISLVTNKGFLFSKSQDPDSGGIYIYTGPPITNSTNGLGFSWERPVSFEYFNPSDTSSFQVNCGFQLQGGHGRRPEKSPKHSFRLVFKNEYGPTRLNYPLFGEKTVSDFNTIVLRAGFGNTWIHHSHSERSMAQYLRDRWSKDTHGAMGNQYSKGLYVHLYLNGLYWGIYNPSERLDSDFSVSYSGGNAEDFDVIKDYAEVVDGNISAWNRAISMANAGLSTTEAYNKIRGRGPDGKPNALIEPLVDVVSLADYMLLNFYGGNWDWDHHNWVAIRNRSKPETGFRFLCWDEEHMVEDINANILSENNNNCPSRIFQQLRQNAEFRRLFADRVQKFCFNNGPLTSESASKRWSDLASTLDNAIIAESARWGDYRRDVHRYQTVGPFELYTKEKHWDVQMKYMLTSYFPSRTSVFINTLRNANMFPRTDAPVVLINNKALVQTTVKSGDQLSFASSEGSIYYTTDGSDPVIWNLVPSVSSSALRFTGPLKIQKSIRIKARRSYNGDWSATTEFVFSAKDDYNDLKITELHYEPFAEKDQDDKEFEFLEFKNTGSATVSLGGLKLTEGIKYVFPKESFLNPGEFIVLASNYNRFSERYGFAPFGEYDGQLSDEGEIIMLADNFGDKVISLIYNDYGDWPAEAERQYRSIVPKVINPTADQNDPAEWRVSFFRNGSPGRDDILKTDYGSKVINSDLISIYMCYPNPFSQLTNLPYELHTDARVEISVLSIAGKKICEIDNSNKLKGCYAASWDGKDSGKNPVPEGIYLMSIRVVHSGEAQLFSRLVVLMR